MSQLVKENLTILPQHYRVLLSKFALSLIQHQHIFSKLRYCIKYIGNYSMSAIIDTGILDYINHHKRRVLFLENTVILSYFQSKKSSFHQVLEFPLFFHLFQVLSILSGIQDFSPLHHLLFQHLRSIFRLLLQSLNLLLPLHSFGCQLIVGQSNLDGEMTSL